MSEFTYNPINNAQVQNKPRVLPARFGDGYEQRIVDGINADMQVWPLTFTDTKANIDAIANFIADKKGVTAFTWTPEGMPEIKVICRQWARDMVIKTMHSFSCTFEQVPA